MLTKLICVGKLKDAALSAKCGEYAKWLGRYGKLELVELNDSGHDRNNANILRVLEDERGFVAALTEEGKLFSTVELAAYWGGIDRKLVLVIGDDAGLSDEVKKRSDMLLSLSPLTFTHEMARMLILEQLFRCCNYNSGGSYHRR